MAIELRAEPEWLATVLLAPDDTEESIVGSDWHQDAITEAHAPLVEHAAELGTPGMPAWYVSKQVMVIATLPRRTEPWRPMPDVYVVPGVAAHGRTSYDSRTEGPMPPFVLEVASEGTWRNDVGEKSILYHLAGVREYLVFDPTGAFLGEPLRGWHLDGELWAPWLSIGRPDGVRVWESALLGLAARPEGRLLRFDHPLRGPLPVRRELRALAEDAEQRALDAERRVAALEDELRRLREDQHGSGGVA